MTRRKWIVVMIRANLSELVPLALMLAAAAIGIAAVSR